MEDVFGHPDLCFEGKLGNLRYALFLSCWITCARVARGFLFWGYSVAWAPKITCSNSKWKAPACKGSLRFWAAVLRFYAWVSRLDRSVSPKKRGSWSSLSNFRETGRETKCRYVSTEYVSGCMTLKNAGFLMLQLTPSSLHRFCHTCHTSQKIYAHATLPWNIFHVDVLQCLLRTFAWACIGLNLSDCQGCWVDACLVHDARC